MLYEREVKVNEFFVLILCFPLIHPFTVCWGVGHIRVIVVLINKMGSKFVFAHVSLCLNMDYTPGLILHCPIANN